MSDITEKTFEQAGAFQKIWMETFTKMAQAGFSFSPDSTPPEFLRQMRSGVFNALSQSWEEYMRTPQFRESMKTMMDNAIAFRKMSSDFFTQGHHSVQGTAREDIDNLMLTIRHLETRVLDRVEALSERLEQLEKKLDGTARNGSAKKPRKTATAKRGTSVKRTATK
ncbi:MAG: hypothetical protein JWQ71_3955 [Pedosphaera sp.]|nr:hypothetical protein [Pedosphaera sp.]